MSETLTTSDKNPKYETSSEASLFSNVKIKLPSKSVVVPFSVPTSTIVAPGNGVPLESITFPEIDL